MFAADTSEVKVLKSALAEAKKEAVSKAEKSAALEHIEREK